MVDTLVWVTIYLNEEFAQSYLVPSKINVMTLAYRSGLPLTRLTHQDPKMVLCDTEFGVTVEKYLSYGSAIFRPRDKIKPTAVSAWPRLGDQLVNFTTLDLLPLCPSIEQFVANSVPNHDNIMALQEMANPDCGKPFQPLPICGTLPGNYHRLCVCRRRAVLTLLQCLWKRGLIQDAIMDIISQL